MTASKANKDRQRVYDRSLLEEIKQDNVEAARKQQSKIRIGVTNQKTGVSNLLLSYGFNL
jgi:hypothetical protein